MAANYTDAQVELMVQAYTNDPTREMAKTLAEEHEKSIKSIIGKLSREGVYQKAIYKTKTGEIPITKEQLIKSIALLLEIDSSKIMGFEKAPKQDIIYLHTILEEKHG